MNIQILLDVGLTETQARAYICLIDNGTQTAPALAGLIGESRTNGYKILDKLNEYGIVIKESRGKKFYYSAASPAALEQFVEAQAETVRAKERRLNTELPHMLDYFFARSERPSIRYLEGREGILKVYHDQITTGEDIYYVRAQHDLNFVGLDELHKLRNLLPRFGINRFAIIHDIETPGIPDDDRMDIAKSDELMLMHRTWITEADYTAPVEWAAYGDKLSIISYGADALGMIIESAPVAEAFRQLFRLIDEGTRRRPSYGHHPLYNTYTKIPESARKK